MLALPHFGMSNQLPPADLEMVSDAAFDEGCTRWFGSVVEMKKPSAYSGPYGVLLTEELDYTPSAVAAGVNHLMPSQ